MEGEKYRSLEITPPVTVNLSEAAYIFADAQPKTVRAVIKCNTNAVNGKLSLALPEGWRSEPASIDFDIRGKYREQTAEFRVFPATQAFTGTLKARAEVGGKTYSNGLLRIDYNHIPVQTLFPRAEAQLVRLDVQKRGNLVGYIMGPGDDVPASLQQMGYQVKLLGNDEITLDTLKNTMLLLPGFAPIIPTKG